MVSWGETYSVLKEKREVMYVTHQLGDTGEPAQQVIDSSRDWSGEGIDLEKDVTGGFNPTGGMCGGFRWTAWDVGFWSRRIVGGEMHTPRQPPCKPEARDDSKVITGSGIVDFYVHRCLY